MRRHPRPVAVAFAPVVPVDLALYLAVGGAVGWACRGRFDAFLLPTGDGRFWPGVIDRRTGREWWAAAPEYPHGALMALDLMGCRTARLLWEDWPVEPLPDRPTADTARG